MQQRNRLLGAPSFAGPHRLSRFYLVLSQNMIIKIFFFRKMFFCLLISASFYTNSICFHCWRKRTHFKVAIHWFCEPIAEEEPMDNLGTHLTSHNTLLLGYIGLLLQIILQCEFSGVTRFELSQKSQTKTECLPLRDRGHESKLHGVRQTGSEFLEQESRVLRPKNRELCKL